MAALGMEYNWDPDSKYARAGLADKYLPNQYDIGAVTTSWIPLSRDGSVDHWESKWTITSTVSPADVLQHMEPSFSNSKYFPRARNLKWIKQGEQKSNDKARSSWRFTDEQGSPWTGIVSIDPVDGRRDSYVVSVKVSKDT